MHICYAASLYTDNFCMKNTNVDNVYGTV